MKNDNLVFRRINGRIVPIRKEFGPAADKLDKATKVGGIISKTTKRDAVNLATIGAGFGISSGAGYYAAKLLKNANTAYGRAAHIRGAAKIIKVKAPIAYASTIRDAARFKITGKVLAKRSFGLLSAGTLVGSTIAGYGAYKFLKNKTDRDTSYGGASLIAGASSALGLASFGKIAKVSHLITVLKNSSSVTPKISDLSKAWSRAGQARTSSVVKQYSSMAGKLKAKKADKVFSTILKKPRKPKDIPGQLRLF